MAALLCFVCLYGLPFNLRAEDTPINVLFFGDSLTAGYGVAAEEAFPAQVRALAARDNISLNAINAGLSADASAGALRRIDWFLREPLDLLWLCIGANDGLRAYDLTQLAQNLTGIVRKVRGKYPHAQIVLAGMRMPPTYGADYGEKFALVFRQVAQQEKIDYYPFLLDGVAGEATLMQADQLHPNAAGHRVIAERVWAFLKPRVQKLRQARVLGVPVSPGPVSAP